MHNLRRIRKQLGITQKALGDGIGCTQGNVYHYEQGQTLSPEMAKKLIEFVGATFGLSLSYDHIYGSACLPSVPTPAGEEVRHG
ncbi:helix-turn-helix domain-containing protein [Delftia acidovorans]|uniref:helix-turn-helix domain-containing protein n=1 Tax=Delftia acidovorans TaxID=80866 RepID=UPI001EDEB9EB|nr:helix-turn-helix transcriptional regulator [Delftia acidovorans]MCG3782747.1 helix-turn-helix transcriptional regulator [Delftia acidovorans]